MAAGSNNTSAPDKETPPSTTGDSTPTASSSPQKPHFVTKKRLVFLFVIVVVLVAGWLIYRKEEHAGEKVYAQAAGHKVYAPELKQTINGNHGITSRQAATVLADKYLLEAIAKRDGVTVSSGDITAAYGKNALGQQKSQPYYYQQMVNRIYLQKINAFNKGIYKGKYLIANYSRNIPYPSPLLAEQEAADPKLGSPLAMAADKKYASDFITKLYNQITTHKISFDQAIQDEQNNSMVGEKAYPTQPHSGSFSTESGYGTILTSVASTYKKIQTIKPGTISRPFVAGDSYVGPGGLYYLVVQMDESKGGSNISLDQTLTQAKQKYGYKIDV